MQCLTLCYVQDVALGSSRATESVDGTSASGECSNLEKAAAELNRKRVFGVVGRGAMGAAYGVRCGDMCVVNFWMR